MNIREMKNVPHFDQNEERIHEMCSFDWAPFPPPSSNVYTMRQHTLVEFTSKWWNWQLWCEQKRVKYCRVESEKQIARGGQCIHTLASYPDCSLQNKKDLATYLSSNY